MLKNISLDYYKIFYVVARELNITAASKKLLISQPAITQTMNKLESQLNTKLFIRQSRGLMLTKVGELLLQEVEKGLVYFDNIENIIEDEEDLLLGELMIGSGSLIARAVLLKAITNFHNTYPNIKIKLTDKPAKEMLKELSLGELDLVVAGQKNSLDKSILYTSILDETYVFVCHRDYNIPQNKQELIKESTFIVPGLSSTGRVVFDEVNESLKDKIEPKIEIAGYSMGVELVKNNVGIAFLPEYIVADLLKDGILKKVSILDERTATQYGYFVNKKSMSRVVKEFIKFL